MFSLLTDWQAEHTERHLTNTDEVTPRVWNNKLPLDIDRYQLTEYRDQHCKVSMCHALGFWVSVVV